MVGNEVIITDYDWLWKDLIQEFFQDFLLLLAPELHALVNLSKGSEFLEQELRQLFPDSELQGVRTGKLAKVFLKKWRREMDTHLHRSTEICREGFCREDV